MHGEVSKTCKKNVGTKADNHISGTKADTSTNPARRPSLGLTLSMSKESKTSVLILTGVDSRRCGGGGMIRQQEINWSEISTKHQNALVNWRKNIPTDMQSALPIALQMEFPSLLNNYYVSSGHMWYWKEEWKLKINAHPMFLHQWSRVEKIRRLIIKNCRPGIAD